MSENLRSVRKLTLEDWKKGNIPIRWSQLKKPNYYREWKNGTKKIDIRIERCIYWSKIKTPSMMDREEFEKIREEQRDIYLLAKKIMVNSQIYCLLEDILDLPEFEQKDIIQDEIGDVEAKLSNSLKRNVRRGATSSNSITPADRDRILENKVAYNNGIRRFPISRQGRYLEFFPFDDLFTAHVDYGYLLELKRIKHEGLSKYLQIDEIENKKSGNASKLDIASEWMDPLIKEIGNLDVPVKVDDVIGIIENEYPSIRDEFDFSELETPVARGGTITKSSIGEVLSFIYKQRYDKDVEANTIYRRYRHPARKYW